MDFSKTYRGGCVLISSTDELHEAISVFRKEKFNNLNIWEFYVIEKVAFLKSFRGRWIGGNYNTEKIYSSINIATLSLKEKSDRLKEDALLELCIGQRYSKTLDLEITCSFIAKLLVDKGSSNTIDNALKEVEMIIDEINLVFYQEYDADTVCIFEQIQNRAHYLRIAENGPKLGILSTEYEIFS